MSQAVAPSKKKHGLNHPALARVRGAAIAIEAGHEQLAHDLLLGMLEKPTADTSPERRLARQFAVALLARIQNDAVGVGNLYMDNPDPRDMLAAFGQLAQATPFIRFGYATANAAILNATANETQIHIVDIGIGSGAQWLALLESVAAREQPLPHVRITGIDVPAPGADPTARLQATGRALEQRARELGIPFRYEAIASTIEELDFDCLGIEAGEALAVNAALALHHVPDGDAVTDTARSRDAVLEKLRRLPMRVLTLVEPDVNHNRLPFLPRLREAMQHYLTLFEVFAVKLAGMPERETLEEAFFGREILNILSGEGCQRVERHERYQAWQARLQRLGFAALNVAEAAHGLHEDLSLETPFSLFVNDDAVRLAWQGESLLAVSAWRPSTTGEVAV